MPEQDSLVTEQFLDALRFAESRGDVNARGDRGLKNPAFGAFQIRLPAFQDVQRLFPQEFGQESFDRVIQDPTFNRLVAQRYLEALESHYGLNTLESLIAGFNAGPTRARQFLHNGRPLPEITLNEIETIRKFMGPP